MQGDGPAECQRNCQLSCTNPCLGNRECERTSTSRQRHLLLLGECCRAGRQAVEGWLSHDGARVYWKWVIRKSPYGRPLPSQKRYTLLHIAGRGARSSPPIMTQSLGQEALGGTETRLQTVYKDVPVLSIAYVPFIAWHIMYYSSQSYAQ